jgi:hypothetical protein
LKRLLIILPAITMVFGMAIASGRIYYSIHLVSYKNLENARSKANSLKSPSRPVFWIKSEIPGEGSYYRVYLGKYENRDEAVANWKRLKKDGTVSHFGIHHFTEPIPPDKHHRSYKKPTSGSAAATHSFYPPRPESRFIDNQDGTISDTKTNLMWIKNGWPIEFLSAVDWWRAADKCKNFRHGDYSDWRLPTINEWRSLIDSRNQNPALVEPNPFRNIIAHMPYWSESDYTLGQGHSYRKQSYVKSYAVTLFTGSINHLNKNEKAFILPVRSITAPDFHSKHNKLTKASPVK